MRQRPWVWETGIYVPVTLLIQSGEADVPFFLQRPRCKLRNAPQMNEGIYRMPWHPKPCSGLAAALLWGGCRGEGLRILGLP